MSESIVHMRAFQRRGNVVVIILMSKDIVVMCDIIVRLPYRTRRCRERKYFTKPNSSRRYDEANNMKSRRQEEDRQNVKKRTVINEIN